jgi:hypothetical protein
MKTTITILSFAAGSSLAVAVGCGLNGAVAVFLGTVTGYFVAKLQDSKE